MFDKVSLNYDDVVKNQSKVLDFLIKKSDTFSVTAIIKRPYSQNPPMFNYDEQIRPFVTKYIFERSDWPVNFLGHMKHQIMVICRCCKDSLSQLLLLPNIFLNPKSDSFEDICFYHNEKLWFGTVTHEKMAFMVNVDNEDVDFFREIGIRAYE